MDPQNTAKFFFSISSAVAATRSDLKKWVAISVSMTVMAIALVAATPAHAQVSEAQVFEWWDAGVITPEQAEEMLSLLDDGELEEACLMAEVYAQESCLAPDAASANRKKTSKTKKRTKSQTQTDKAPTRPSLAPHGLILYKARFDSLGHQESHREELQVSFYRYTLKLGSQELFAYKNSGSEAYFGQISSRELHSHFLLDTLWGTALLYPIGRIHVAGLLDTSMVTQFRLGYRFGKTGFAEGIYWETRARENGDRERSVALQTKSSAGKISAWYKQGADAPLVKADLHGGDGEDDRVGSEALSLSWRTTAYYHGDSVPDLARLSSTILKSRLWGSQTISAKAKKAMNTLVSVNVRIINPLHSDSVSSRIKGTVQSGPAFLRGTAQATCLEAQDNCEKMDYRGALEWTATEHLRTGASARTRHTRHEGLSTPNLEAHLQFQDNPGNFARISVKFPETHPEKRLQIQNEGHFSAGFLEVSLVTTFKKSAEKGLHPSQGNITVKVSF